MEGRREGAKGSEGEGEGVERSEGRMEGKFDIGWPTPRMPTL